MACTSRIMFGSCGKFVHCQYTGDRSHKHIASVEVPRRDKVGNIWPESTEVTTKALISWH